MRFIKTAIPDVILIEPRVFEDERGYFMETFRQDLFEKEVGKINFIQENESKSKKGVLRGLHYQLPPFAQSKLVRVIKGKVLDVAVDIRKSSKTFGRYVAHGFLVLEDDTVFSYKVDNYYAPEYERSIKFDDPLIGIKWKFNKNELILSIKDLNALGFHEAELFD